MVDILDQGKKVLTEFGEIEFGETNYFSNRRISNIARKPRSGPLRCNWLHSPPSPPPSANNPVK
jgi:hypothetical protein